MTRSSAEVSVTEASATAVGTLSLAWEVLPRDRPELRWCVQVVAEESDATPLVADSLASCHASFTGLASSTSYRFSIEAMAPPPPPPPSVERVTIVDLSVTGSKLGCATSSAVSMPKTLEGVVVLPPFAKGKLAALEADPYLKPLPLGLPGAFLRVPGSRSRNS